LPSLLHHNDENTIEPELDEFSQSTNVKASVLKQGNESLADKLRQEANIEMERNDNDRGGTIDLLGQCEDVETVSISGDGEDANATLLGLHNGPPKEDLGRHYSAQTPNVPKIDVMPIKYVRLSDDGEEVSPLAVCADGMTVAERFYGYDECDFTEEFADSNCAKQAHWKKSDSYWKKSNELLIFLVS